MKIAIDARELAGKPTGVGRYLRGILRGWNEIPAAAAHRYVLCSDIGVHDHTLSNLQIEYVVSPWPVHGTAWEQTALPVLAAKSGADVLFAPGYTAPLLAPIPSVVTIHDVSFAAHPEWFSWREGWRRRVLTRFSARRAAKVITVSDFSKREIVRRLGVAPARVEVIYSGVTRLAHKPPGDAPPDPFVLFVGSLFNRRHIPDLIEGFTRLAERHASVRLELVGDNRTRPYLDIDGLVARSRARDRIRVRSYVGEPELAGLYAHAAAFVFLSDYEGFALTPMEALSAGIPVALLDTEVAREIYGPAALYLPRPEPELIAQALERLLIDPAERSRVLAAADGQLARYSWRECAQRTLQVLLACTRS